MDGTGIEAIGQEVRDLVVQQRDRCLWFLRPDLLPQTREEMLIALGHIRKHGDRATYVRARELADWLSRNTSDESVGS